MHNQARGNPTPQKVLLRYVNGPTENYQCEVIFNLGYTESVSAKTADELLLKYHDGKRMFVRA